MTHQIRLEKADFSYLAYPFWEGGSNMASAGKMTVAELKKALRALSYDEMEGLVCSLYKDFKEVERCLNGRFNASYAAMLLEDFSKEIGRHLPFSLRPMSTANAKKALIAFRKAAPNREVEAELLLRFFEHCVEFTCTFGDIDEPFYNAAADSFAGLVDLINREDDDRLYEKLRERIDKAVSSTSNIGWGFREEVYDIACSIVWRGKEGE